MTFPFHSQRTFIRPPCYDYVIRASVPLKLIAMRHVTSVPNEKSYQWETTLGGPLNEFFVQIRTPAHQQLTLTQSPHSTFSPQRIVLFHDSGRTVRQRYALVS